MTGFHCHLTLPWHPLTHMSQIWVFVLTVLTFPVAVASLNLIIILANLLVGTPHVTTDCRAQSLKAFSAVLRHPSPHLKPNYIVIRKCFVRSLKYPHMIRKTWRNSFWTHIFPDQPRLVLTCLALGGFYLLLLLKSKNLSNFNAANTIFNGNVNEYNKGMYNIMQPAHWPSNSYQSSN